tara:strand:+ start:39703 stop:39876 length:174 start_codon:yes stop_codon:yes gene_type:complete
MKTLKSGLMAVIIASALSATVSAAPADVKIGEIKKFEQPTLMAKERKPKSGGIIIRW